MIFLFLNDSLSLSYLAYHLIDHWGFNRTLAYKLGNQKILFVSPHN
jgi:hypothetical protein